MFCNRFVNPHSPLYEITVSLAFDRAQTISFIVSAYADLDAFYFGRLLPNGISANGR